MTMHDVVYLITGMALGASIANLIWVIMIRR